VSAWLCGETLTLMAVVGTAMAMEAEADFAALAIDVAVTMTEAAPGICEGAV
jgi:hypothetical protein